MVWDIVTPVITEATNGPVMPLWFLGVTLQRTSKKMILKIPLRDKEVQKLSLTFKGFLWVRKRFLSSDG